MNLHLKMGHSVGGNILPVEFRLMNSEDIVIWDKIFKNGPSEICGRQPLENMK